MKQDKYKEPLPLAVIEASRAGDAGAMEQVLRYYDGYINKLCTGCSTTLRPASCMRGRIYETQTSNKLNLCDSLQ